MADQWFDAFYDGLEAAAKERYTKSYLEKLYYTENPFLALIRKDETFTEKTKDVKIDIDKLTGRHTKDWFRTNWDYISQRKAKP